jgi:hypothetical protein
MISFFFLPYFCTLTYLINLTNFSFTDDDLRPFLTEINNLLDTQWNSFDEERRHRYVSVITDSKICLQYKVYPLIQHGGDLKPCAH